MYYCKRLGLDKILLKRRSMPTLYRLCIRVIARNSEQCNCDDWDLSQLPATIKYDLLRFNMKFSIGFTNEKTFVQLLTPNVTKLSFRSSILTDTMLLCIGERCNNLQELRIFESNDDKLAITADGLQKCLQRLHNIRTLQISESHQVNDKTIEVLRQSCPHLQSLWLNDCKNITDESTESLESMELNDLNLANTSITNDWLYKLCDSTLMKSLRDICLRNCNITNDGLKSLNWKRLENINIIGVSIRDLSFIPATAKYKTLNWSV